MDLQQLLKLEEDQLVYIESELHSSKVSIGDKQELINSWYYSLGRKSFVEDLIKQQYGYQEREFQIRKKKGTLFERT